MNLFKIYDNIFIGALVQNTTAVALYDATVVGTDDIERWCKATIEWEEEFIEYEAQLTHYRQYYTFGFRPTINISIKIVNLSVKSKVNDLLALINVGREDIYIFPNLNKAGGDNGLVNIFTKMRLKSSIAPKEISDSVRIGETLELTFESKICYPTIPILRDAITNVGDVTGATITDSSGDLLLGGFL